MNRYLLLSIVTIFILPLLFACHGAQEKAWEDAIEATNARVQEDEFLSRNIHSFDLERRQWIRLYIKPQVARTGFSKTASGFAEIMGEELFKQDGNKLKELLVYGNLITEEAGIEDELVIVRYTPSSGAEVIKDRTAITM